MGSQVRTIVVLEDVAFERLGHMLESQYADAGLNKLSSPEAALEAISEQKPDLAIIDLQTITDRPAKFIEDARRGSPQTTLVVACNVEEDDETFAALKAGARGYLVKDGEDDQMIKHLSNILQGQPTVAPGIAHKMLGYFHKQPQLDNEVGLSKREQEILKLIASGWKRAEVSQKLNISPNTVASHLKTIYSKLDINSRSEATLAALRRGLIKK